MYPGFGPHTGFVSDVFFAEVVDIFGSASAITELWTPDGLTLSGDTVVSYDPDHERLVATNQTNKSAYSTDGGATWVAGGNLPASRQWDSLAYDTTHKRMLAVSCSGTDRITAYSTDGGVTWTQGGTIPGITSGGFRQLVCDPKLGRVIGPLYSSTPPKYICTDDGGTTWTVIDATGSTSASGTAMGIVPY